jgi:hypothetical protein
VAPVIVVEGVTGVSDVGDRSGLPDSVECFDRFPPGFEQDAVRHRWAPVDSHVAVDEQDGIDIAESVGAERKAGVEPLVGFGDTVVVGTDPPVDHVGGMLSNKLFIGPLEPGVEHVRDPGLFPPFELLDCLIRILVEIAADDDAVREGTEAAVPMGHVGVAVHGGVHCAASIERIVLSSTENSKESDASWKMGQR